MPYLKNVWLTRYLKICSIHWAQIRHIGTRSRQGRNWGKVKQLNYLSLCCLICAKWIEQIVKYIVNHSFLGCDARVLFLNKHYYETKKRNFNFKKYSQNHFICIIWVQMTVLTNLTVRLKNGVIFRKSVAGNVIVQNFVRFRSVVFEILMNMCFDSSISKARP